MYARTSGITPAMRAGSRTSRRSGSKGSARCSMAALSSRSARAADSRGVEELITIGAAEYYPMRVAALGVRGRARLAGGFPVRIIAEPADQAYRNFSHFGHTAGMGHL